MTVKDGNGAEPEVPKEWRGYSVEFHFLELVGLTMPLLQLIEVNFSYLGWPDFRLTNVDSGIDMGTRIEIVGPNGAGKSTLLNLRARDLQPAEGEVKRSQKLRIGRYSHHFVDPLTMEENVIQFLLHRHPEQSKVHSINKRLFVLSLGSWGFPNRDHLTSIIKLSCGQDFQVDFTSISMSTPHIHLLDVPMNNLDLHSIDTMAEASEEFMGGVVWVSHDLRLIFRVSEDIEQMFDELLGRGNAPSEVKNNSMLEGLLGLSFSQQRNSIALGYKYAIIPIFTIAISIFVSFSFAMMDGIIVAALGMLSIVATGLATDAYDPISDNSGDIAEMSTPPPANSQKVPFLSINLDKITIVCGLTACSQDLEKVESIFLEMPLRDKFSWSAMISRSVQGVCFARALLLAEQMLHSYVEPNKVTLVSLLSACSHLVALDRGRQIHSYIEQNTEKRDVSLMNALTDMYTKCGCFDNAQQIFDGMLQRDTHSWNAMIRVFMTHGRGREAIKLFNQMQITAESKPANGTLMVLIGMVAQSASLGMMDAPNVSVTDCKAIFFMAQEYEDAVLDSLSSLLTV